MILVDTNVLIDILENDPKWSDWSVEQLRNQSQIHDLIINPIIYSELSLAFLTFEALDKVIRDLGLSLLEIPRPALFLAGKAFIRYKREGGKKSNVLADFFIGAHAAVLKCPILTRDEKRYRSYFQNLSIITPDHSKF